jgi:hypothetical protein
VDEIDKFFRKYKGFKSRVIKGSTVTIASGHNAQFKNKIIMPRDVRQECRRVLAEVTDEEAERQALLELSEHFIEACKKVLSSRGKERTSWFAPHEENEMNAVDIAWNLTVFLMWLENEGLLTYHTVRHPVRKFTLTNWRKTCAVVQSKINGAEFAVLRKS